MSGSLAGTRTHAKERAKISSQKRENLNNKNPTHIPQKPYKSPQNLDNTKESYFLIA